jgi:hypothetical protein
VFSAGESARVLAATAPGFSLRLVTNCGDATVKAYNPHTREFTVKSLALYSWLQITFLTHPLFCGCTNQPRLEKKPVRPRLQ